MSMLDRVRSTADLEAPWTHWFFYGDTGSSKTTMAATFPAPVFLVTRAENSIVTLRKHDPPVPYLIIDTPDELEDFVDELLDIQTRKGADELPYETIVIESMAHYIDVIIAGLTDGKRHGMMDKQRWGKLTAHINRMQAKLRALQVHAIYTSLVKRDTNDNGAVCGAAPMLSGQMAYKLPASCDVIGFCRVTEAKKYRVHFRTYKAVYPARSRFPGLPEEMDDFAWAKVAQLI